MWLCLDIDITKPKKNRGAHGTRLSIHGAIFYAKNDVLIGDRSWHTHSTPAPADLLAPFSDLLLIIWNSFPT